MIYFDHNATTRIHPEVRAALATAEEVYGNPSSVHAAGRAARDLVERARRQVAALIGAAAEEIVFTSGGTEADQLALRGVGGPLVTTAIEHPAVLGAVENRTVVAVGADGVVDPDAIERAVDTGTRLVSVQLANHELGTIQPVAEVAARLRTRGILVHTDAVQAAGKIAIDVRALGVDLLSLSAHKIHGPKGAGALWIRRGVRLEPLGRGGHQERERRPGTENVSGIIGFGAAAELAARSLASWSAHLADLRDRFERGALALGARRHGDPSRRVPGTSNIGFPGVPGELLMMNLDLAGVAVSTGAACTSGSVAVSPVLLALGLPRERAAEGLRVSFGPENTAREVDQVLALLPPMLERIRAA